MPWPIGEAPEVLTGPRVQSVLNVKRPDELSKLVASRRYMRYPIPKRIVCAPMILVAFTPKSWASAGFQFCTCTESVEYPATAICGKRTSAGFTALIWFTNDELNP